jgi:PAS domain S-box-containing protein
VSDGQSRIELEQLKFAIDQSAIVATTDVSGRITYVNDTFCAISKYDRHELLGQDHRIINSGSHPKEFIRGLWRTIANGAVWRGELCNRAKDGSLYWVDTTIVPFLQPDGRPWQYMAIRYDITARKAHEQRLRETAALARLGEMAAVVAHEVRNPLAGIRGGVQLLGSHDALDADGRELISDIVARIDSLNAVLSDLLVFARFREVQPAPVDLRLLVEDVAASMSLDPAMRGVALSVDLPPQAMVMGDVDQLRQVLMNLVLNAGQALDHDGYVRVTVEPAPDAITVVIADSGPGIAPELRERVFEPFFTTRHRGTGLGLATARRIVEAHGGTLSFGEPAAGEPGAVARMRLPRHAVA